MIKDSIFFRLILPVTGYAAGLLALELYLSGGDMAPDSYAYLDFARDIARNGWSEAAGRHAFLNDFPPLLAMLVAALIRCGVEAELAGRAVNIAGCLIAAAGVAVCCRQLYRDRTAALCAALAVMSLPGWYAHGSGVLRDPLYWMAAVWSAAVLMDCSRHFREESRRRLDCLLLGGLAGLAMLCRKEALFLAAAECIWFGLLIFRSGASGRLRMAGGMALPFLAPLFAVLLLPLLAGSDYSPFRLLTLN